MEAEIGKYGVWLSDGDMQIIEKALDWFENSSYVFNETSKIGSIKNLRRDFQKIKAGGVQIPKKVEISKRQQFGGDTGIDADYDERYNNEIECKECD
jgi:hypothetical protein